jgi:hypothetical protein
LSRPIYFIPIIFHKTSLYTTESLKTSNPNPRWLLENDEKNIFPNFFSFIVGVVARGYHGCIAKDSLSSIEHSIVFKNLDLFWSKTEKIDFQTLTQKF